MAPFVQTVLGRIDPAGLGFTLPHEHTQCQLWTIPERFDYWELTADEELVAAELERFRAGGGTCLVDVTLPGIGRDPAWLRGLAARTGLHLVMGTGWYREPYYPPDALVDRRSVAELAAVMVAEFEEGVPGSEGPDGARVRPGIIGEIGVHKPWVSAQEERVLRACGRAARATGMAVTTHAVLSPVGLRQLDILEDAGADPRRVVIGHADSYPVLDHWLAIVARGASIECDFLGMAFTPMERKGEPRVIELILRLLERGHVDRILLSQDVCDNSQLVFYGGNGYAYLQEAFLPRLRAAGVGEEEIRRITVDNPRRILSIG
ncbi:MAG: phosphotriesterase-related protein [Chloroflexi bacterium]|nr:phosphotriesterase-related protein [Chloroflexota bacterium]